MAAFRSIVFAGALAGLVAGLLITVLQAIGTTPLILAAEAHEQAAHAHGHAAQTEEDGAAEAWAPADGIERTGYTVLANLVTATGFSLLLIAGFALAGRPIGWREGLLWGLAGFVAFALAPFLGLPPEPPGMPSAEIDARQVWWAMTAAATASGLALLAFTRAPLTVVAGLALLIAPHLIGAPQATDTATAVPAALAHRFATVVIVTSLVFWAALGVLSALFFDRFARMKEFPSR